MTKNELLVDAFYMALGEDQTARDAACVAIGGGVSACLADIIADEDPPDNGDDDLTMVELQEWKDQLDEAILAEQTKLILICIWRIWIGMRAAKKVVT